MKDNDTLRSANDNYLTAKMLGLFVLCDGDDEEQEEMPDGSCDMHFANMCSGLALSVAIRSSGGDAINRWVPFQNLWIPCKKMSKSLCNRNNERHETYEKIMMDSGGTSIMCLLNETRIARVLLLL